MCAHPHCWTSMDWSIILILLLKHDNFDSNILLLQDPNKHLNSMALILWTTKDQAFILISFLGSLGINKLFYVAGNSYPTTKFSQNINSTTSTWFSFRNWIEIQGKVNQSKHHYFPTSLQSQKPPEFPQNNRYSSQDKTHSMPSSKSLETSCMSYHITTPKILGTFILSLVLVPTKNTCNNSRPFPDILSTAKVF